VEKVYEKAFSHELRKAGFSVQQQYPIKVKYDNVVVGEFFADLFVDEQILIELKAVSTLDSNHIAQALNYLRATGLDTCLLINFGTPRIQVRNLKPSPHWKRV
jgi:GxxExxY protein